MVVITAQRWLMLLFALIAVVQAVPLSSNNSDATQSPLSGCQVCAESGDCLHAYLDAPGQFCGNWLDRASQRQRCCCPREATCAVSNYACNCRTSTTKKPTKVSTSTTSSRTTSTRLGTILGSVALLFCGSAILWCLCPCCRANKYAALSQQPPMSPVVIQAPPVYAQQAYGPGYGHAYGPGYPPAYNGNYSNGGMGAGSSAMLGGTAGFFGGMLLGQALSNSNRGHHSYHSDNSCYDSSSGGGEEFGGDF